MTRKLLTFLIACLFISCNNSEVSPRDMNGKTVLRTPDSVYYITFKIDSVFEMEYEPEDNRP